MTDFESKRPENGIEHKQAQKATYYFHFYVDDARSVPSLKIAKIMAPDVDCARMDAREVMKKQNVAHGFLTLDVGEVNAI